MNDTSELWSLPWHALLGNLAKGFGPDAAGGVVRTGVPDKPVPGRPVATRAIASHGGAVATNSWLVQARSRVAPLQPVRRRHA